MPGHERERWCALERCQRPASELIRFVAGPDGDLVPDLKRKLPGRGIWVTALRDSIERAAAGNVFQRALKGPVRVAKELPALIETLLEQHALAALSMASKAGCVVSGAERVVEAIEHKDLHALVHASDAGEDGCRKLDGKLAARRSGSVAPSAVTCFTRAQLSLALGRTNVVHAALIEAEASRKFVEQTLRLLHYRLNSFTLSGPEGR